ncbi:MAG: hypothetical protein ABEI86_13490 [Halobacteriaceae archaeon]
MPDTHIALIFDFDDTLVPDSTSQFLAENGIDPDNFWTEEHKPLLEKGYDPANAWLQLILDRVGPDNELGEITTEDLRHFGTTLNEETFDGLPELFEDLNDIVDDYHDTTIDYYIISGGLRNIILGTEISDYMTAIYASEFAQHHEDWITHIKRSVNFTEKTRYLFEINKGLQYSHTRTNPYIVNTPMDESERRVPWENMIYVGDGTTDVPCFSLIKKQGGQPYGIFNPDNESSKQQAIELMEAPDRVQAAYKPKFSESGDIGNIIRSKVEGICFDNETSGHQAL